MSRNSNASSVMPRLLNPLSTTGRIDRRTFIIGITGVLAGGGLAIWASLAALPWMASVLAPRGINAALALNAIWAAVGVLTVWCLSALCARRLRARGRWPWWGAVAMLPPAVLAVLNDAVFLASRYVSVPDVLQSAVLAAAGLVAAWVLYEGLRSAH